MKQKFTFESASEYAEYLPDAGMFRRKKHPHSLRSPTPGWLDHKGYRRIQVDGKTVLAHRLAWLLHYGEWPDGEIDHINGIKDDNRIENLRICTHPQNNHNQPLRKTNTSGVKGVYWNKKQRKWRGQVCINYRMHHTGGFEDIADAEKAVIALRERLHGEFANHG